MIKCQVEYWEILYVGHSTLYSQPFVIRFKVKKVIQKSNEVKVKVQRFNCNSLQVKVF